MWIHVRWALPRVNPTGRQDLARNSKAGSIWGAAIGHVNLMGSGQSHGFSLRIGITHLLLVIIFLKKLWLATVLLCEALKHWSGTKQPSPQPPPPPRAKDRVPRKDPFLLDSTPPKDRGPKKDRSLQLGRPILLGYLRNWGNDPLKFGEGHKISRRTHSQSITGFTGITWSLLSNHEVVTGIPCNHFTEVQDAKERFSIHPKFRIQTQGHPGSQNPFLKSLHLPPLEVAHVAKSPQQTCQKRCGFHKVGVAKMVI